MLQGLIMMSLAMVLGTTAAKASGAFGLSCGPRVGSSLNGEPPRLQIQGQIETVRSGLYVLTYTLRYDIACRKGGACRIAEQLAGAGVINSSAYRPEVYLQHLQFLLDTPSANAEQVQLLIPEAALVERSEVFPATLMFSGLEASYGVSIPLSCQGQATASRASDRQETLEQELQRARRLLAADFGLGQLPIEFERKALKKALAKAPGDAVSFSRAFLQALTQIFIDTDSPETPLLIALSAVAQERSLPIRWPLTQAESVLARQQLQRELQESGSIGVFTGFESHDQVLPPENGESPFENWIFTLSIPSLSDHYYWVIVDRQGLRAPYVYGFN